jgi:hypothetical protein
LGWVSQLQKGRKEASRQISQLVSFLIGFADLLILQFGSPISQFVNTVEKNGFTIAWRQKLKLLATFAFSFASDFATIWQLRNLHRIEIRGNLKVPSSSLGQLSALIR